MKTISTVLLLSVLTALSAKADLLLQDSTNYPYTDGCIEGQGQWYCDYPSKPSLDALVTNNVLFLNTTNHDEVATPTNGWINNGDMTFASFTINVSKLPSVGGGYFCQFQDQNGTNHCCHVFIDTRDTVVPGTFRLGIASYATSFAALTPPVNYPMDLSTNIPYTVVVLFDNNQSDYVFGGSTLWINPSKQDFENVADGLNVSPGIGEGFVYGTDFTANQNLLGIKISQIGFSPYANAGISNVMVGTSFDDVNLTNAPVIGIQPQSGTNYSGNSATFYTVASGVDLTYQWYSQTTGALHDDGVNVAGANTNILVVNNLSSSDNYYVVVTDAYGQTATSAAATNTVITTPTAPFFPASVTALNLTNSLFTSTGFTNTALGTGPLYYQWYFAPTNTPNTFAPLTNQTNAALKLSLVDYTFGGSYFVVVSNTIANGSLAFGPTNSLTETAPLLATLSQLHNLMISMSNQIAGNKSGTVTINSNTVTVGGYVTTYGGFGSTYNEFFIQDDQGYGIQVYLAGFGNTNTPPVGTYVTVSGPVVVYHTELEIEPTSQSAIVINPDAPRRVLAPRLANGMFNDLSTNGLGTNAFTLNGSLVTFTNVYIYGSKTGGAIGNGGVFSSNYYTILYFTIGQYHYPDNTNWIESYQFGYNYGPAATPISTNSFALKPVPTQCYQLTGVYLNYGGTPEILPSRLEDYVINQPSAFRSSIAESKGHPTISWPVQTGSTYSVYSATNLLGPWTQAAYGLGYYPTNGTFTDTNVAQAKFYRISTP